MDGTIAERPLVIFVDDLQWADASLRDVILYLLAGPRDRRLAVLVTARTAGLPDGHPWYGWLADAVRLPHVDHLELGPLDRAGTEAQVADLLGSHAHQSLIDDVFGAGMGNPYFTSLLTRSVQPSDRHLSHQRPADLTAAVASVWHRCSGPTRTVACLLAVGGEPEQGQTLRDLAGDLGLAVDVAGSLAEAHDAGLVERLVDGRYWFRHPIQAEVLERSVPDADRRCWQAAYARHGEEQALAVWTTETAAAQAMHHDGAGSAVAAYRWALRAWELGRGRRGTQALRTVLRRAIALRPQVPEASEGLDELWERLRSLAADAGAFAQELEALEALITLTDEARQPLSLSMLLVRRMLVRVTAAVEFYSLADAEGAVELASVDQSSWQYALALAELAHVRFWDGDIQAAGVAAEALAIARAAGEPTALSFALTAVAMLDVEGDRPDAASRLAAEAVDQAAAARDWWAYVHAVNWENNALPEPFGQESAAHLRRRRQQLAELGGPDPYLIQLSAEEAELDLELGDWRQCQRLLREAVIADPGPVADIRSRTVAARLAAYQGRASEALAHVERAAELIAGQRQYRNLNVDATAATVLLEAGRPAEAYRIAFTAVTDPGLPVDLVERLLPLAARALADQAELARDHGRDDRDHLATLTELRGRFPAVIAESGWLSPLMRTRLSAMQTWYDAETARAHRSAEEPGLWVSIRAGCEVAQLAWLNTYACWRAAEVHLRRPADGRAEGVRLLRAGHELATELGADGIRRELEELGRLAHIHLGTDAVALVVDDPRLGTLTPREREILGHLAQGLTYAEIAQTLVVSEKTVSSHVSNLLRKTNTPAGSN